MSDVKPRTAAPPLLLALLCLAPAFLFADEDASKVFDDIYAQRIHQVASTPQTADDLDLGKQLLDAARTTTAAPALLALLCDNAAALAAKDPDGPATALAALKLLGDSVPAKRTDANARAQSIAQRAFNAAKEPDKTAAGQSLLNLQLAAADMRLEEKDFAAASDLYRRALPVAAAIKSDKLPAIKAAIAAVSARDKASAQAKRLTQHLSEKPDDQPAAMELVKTCVVDLDDPQQAAQFLLFVSDPAWKANIALAAEPASATDPQRMTMGDWYRAFADEAAPTSKRAMLVRARDFYQRFVDAHAADDLAGHKASLMLKDMDAQLARLAASPADKARPQDAGLDLLKIIDLAKDTIDGHNDAGGEGSWALVDHKLRSPRRGWSRINFPLKLEGSFRSEIKFTRGKGLGSLIVVFPVGDKIVALRIDAQREVSGLDTIEGYGSLDAKNPTYAKGLKLVPDHDYTLEIEVVNRETDATIRAGLDGKPLLSWTGKKNLLPASNWATWPNRFSVMPWLSQFDFASIKLKVTTGKAELLRPAPK
jgi:hypothetical protein